MTAPRQKRTTAKTKGAAGAEPVRAYAAAGVDIAAGDRVKAELPRLLAKATRPEVIGAVGGFGGLFRFPRGKWKDPVLVSSIDGVGTKLKLATRLRRWEGLGHDLVNHCVGDIGVVGAEPLFFLDYIGMGKLDPEAFRGLIAGMAAACAAAGCALVGGETAQLPGLYQPGDFDLAGCIVGVAERARLLSGEPIRAGDVVLGLASSGLHTNGYSLAQKLLFETKGLDPEDAIPGTKVTFGEALLRPHTNYGPVLLELNRRLNLGVRTDRRRSNGFLGAAHITGGGFAGNLPRILPEGVDVVIETWAWPKVPLFRYLETESGVAPDELYEVFNMGIGMALVVTPESVDGAVRIAKKHGHACHRIGVVTEGRRSVVLKGF